MTQREIIKKYIESTGWIKEGLVRGIETEWGFIGFRGDRDVRQMIKDGILQKRMDGKFCLVNIKPSIQLPESRKFVVDTRQNNLL